MQFARSLCRWDLLFYFNTLVLCSASYSSVTASNTLLHAYMYIALPFGMLQVHFLAIWALEHHFAKLKGGRSMVPPITLPSIMCITLPGDLGTWTPLPKDGMRKMWSMMGKPSDVKSKSSPIFKSKSTLLKKNAQIQTKSNNSADAVDRLLIQFWFQFHKHRKSLKSNLELELHTIDGNPGM